MEIKDHLCKGIKGLASLSQADKDWVVEQLVQVLRPYQVDAIDEFVAMVGAAVKRPQVFLSHSSADKSLVRATSNFLRKCHLVTWFDEAQLDGGSPLIQTISKAIERGDVVVAFLSKESVTSKWVAKELKWAMTRELEEGTQTRVIPVLLEDCNVPRFLKDKLRIDFRSASKR